MFIIIMGAKIIECYLNLHETKKILVSKSILGWTERSICRIKMDTTFLLDLLATKQEYIHKFKIFWKCLSIS